MKIELEIAQDKLELLQKFRTLPSVVSNHLGNIPPSFPSGCHEVERITELCQDLEWKWKKWIVNVLIAQKEICEFVEGVVAIKKDDYISVEDLI